MSLLYFFKKLEQGDDPSTPPIQGLRLIFLKPPSKSLRWLVDPSDRTSSQGQADMWARLRQPMGLKADRHPTHLQRVGGAPPRSPLFSAAQVLPPVWKTVPPGAWADLATGHRTRPGGRGCVGWKGRGEGAHPHPAAHRYSAGSIYRIGRDVWAVFLSG